MCVQSSSTRLSVVQNPESNGRHRAGRPPPRFSAHRPRPWVSPGPPPSRLLRHCHYQLSRWCTAKFGLVQAVHQVFRSSLSSPQPHRSQRSRSKRPHRPYGEHEPDPCYPSRQGSRPQGRQARRPRLAGTYRGSSYRGSVHSTSPLTPSVVADPYFSLGLRLYHCTSSEDLHPSHTRNFGRNIKVSQFIKQKTGVYRSTRQISSRIQVLRSLWRDTDRTSLAPPTPPSSSVFPL